MLSPFFVRFVLAVIIYTYTVCCEPDEAGIYAIGGYEWNPTYNITEHASLLKYDILTGNSTLLYKSNWNWTQNSKSCFDDKYDIWYFLMEVTTFLNKRSINIGRYNLKTKTRLSDISLSNYFEEIQCLDCIGDPVNGGIYIFGNEGECFPKAHNKTVLIKITSSLDKDNDIIINEIAEYSQEVFNSSLTIFGVGHKPVLDSKRNLGWFAAGGITPQQTSTPELFYYLDLKTGNILNIVEASDYPFKRSGIYHDLLDKIIGLEWSDPPNFDNSTWALKYADPQSLEIANSFNGFEYCLWFSRSPTIDIDKNIFYEIMAETYGNTNCASIIPQFHLVGIDINNGNILTQPKVGDNKTVNFFAPFDIIYWNGK